MGVANGLSKRHRLSFPAEFQRALRMAGIRIRAGPVRVLAVANAMPSARLGLIVGKRAIRKAHQRNRIKRTAREAFRLHRSTLPELDVVLHVQAPVSPKELKASLERAFEKMYREAGRLC